MTFRILTRSGRAVAEKIIAPYDIPQLDWYGQRRGGRVARPGDYRVRATVADLAGNRRTYGRRLYVSHAQLVQQTWTQTLAATATSTYVPNFGGCLGCPDYCDPVASSRFVPGFFEFSSVRHGLAMGNRRILQK